MEHVLITGASGFIGKQLSLRFLEKGSSVTGLGTSENHPFSELSFKSGAGFKWIRADTSKEGSWQEHVGQSDIIVNLAGRNIFSYWTKKYKHAIYHSRVKTTQNLVNAMGSGKTRKLLNASAVGIYGDAGDDVLTEEKDPGKGFLAQVCRDWEAAALKAREKGIQTSIMRFGVVLGKGGALSAMLPGFKFFAGGPLGSGRQWFPWVHLADLLRVIEFLAGSEDGDGTFNVTGPVPVRQKSFAKSLGRVLKRPAVMPAPSFIVKTVMGELGASLLQSQRAIPQNLLNSGFSFLFKEADAALDDILGK